MTSIDSSSFGEFITFDDKPVSNLNSVDLLREDRDSRATPAAKPNAFDKTSNPSDSPILIEIQDVYILPDIVAAHVADPRNRLDIELRLKDVRNGVPGHYKLNPMEAAALQLPPVELTELVDLAFKSRQLEEPNPNLIELNRLLNSPDSANDQQRSANKTTSRDRIQPTQRQRITPRM